MTGGAVNPMLTRGARQAQSAFADGAGAIHVRFAVTDTAEGVEDSAPHLTEKGGNAVKRAGRFRWLFVVAFTHARGTPFFGKFLSIILYRNFVKSS